MPLYEYHCEACGHEFEALSSFARADEMECEKCGSTKVTRLASAFCSAIQGGGAASEAPPCLSGGG